MGLFLLPCLRLPRQFLYALPVFAVYLIFSSKVSGNGSVLPAQGDVLDRTGYVMWYYNASPIWNEAV